MCNSIFHEIIAKSIGRVRCQAIKWIHNIAATLRHLQQNYNTQLTRSRAVAETADHTAYDALIIDHPDKNTLTCSQLHK